MNVVKGKSFPIFFSSGMEKNSFCESLLYYMRENNFKERAENSLTCE